MLSEGGSIVPHAVWDAMTEPLITEDENPNPDEVTDDGLGIAEPEVVPADVDEDDPPEAPDEPTLDKEV